MLKPHECVPSRFYWWHYADDDRILVKMRYCGKDYVSVIIAAANEKQVLRAGYCAGEVVNTSPLSLSLVEGI